MKKRFVLIENIKNPIVLELEKQPHNEGYITMNKSDLARGIPFKLRKILAKRGLASNVEIGLKTNKRFCWHRLVTCLYYNCIGKFVHHIRKNSLDINDITNLIVVTENEHKSLDGDNIHGLERSIEIQKRLKDDLYKPKKQTLANNDSIILQILELKQAGFTTKAICKKLKNKIKKTKIYEHLRTFFYYKEFLEWLKNLDNKDFYMLNGKLSFRWDKIISFEAM